jgi:hypothetical protein
MQSSRIMHEAGLITLPTIKDYGVLTRHCALLLGTALADSYMQLVSAGDEYGFAAAAAAQDALDACNGWEVDRQVEQAMDALR